MKTLFLMVVIVVVVFPFNIYCQNQKKIKAYEIWITKIDNSKILGFLYSADLNKLKVSYSGVASDSTNLQIVNAYEIKSIKLRKSRKVLGFGIIGGVIGAGIGVAIGQSEFHNTEGIQVFDEGEAAVISGALFCAIGAGSGIALAKLKRTILVKGNINVYRQHLRYLNKCSIKQMEN